jgi:hypothetical protein
VRRAAGRALTGRGGLLEPEDPFHLAQFGVDVLEHGGLANQYVHPDPVTDRHLVYQPTQIPLELGQTGIQLVPASLKVNGGLGLRWFERPGGSFLAVAAAPQSGGHGLADGLERRT